MTEKRQLHVRIARSQAGWLFGVAFQQRFDPDTRKVKAFLEDKKGKSGGLGICAAKRLIRRKLFGESETLVGLSWFKARLHQARGRRFEDVL